MPNHTWQFSLCAATTRSIVFSLLYISYFARLRFTRKYWLETTNGGLVVIILFIQ